MATSDKSDYYPRKRSRGGCIDCKKAKVKCDEARPSCGTCARRGHICQGYKALDSRSGARRPSTSSTVSIPKHTRQSSSSSSSLPSASTWQSLSPIPPGVISEADEEPIKQYFTRHPVEIVIEQRFVDEMNAHTLLVFQCDPEAIADTLYAIGQIYLEMTGNGSLVPALDRRARTLARLRNMQNDSDRYGLEQLIMMILGLSAMELIDIKSQRRESAIVSLIACCASIVNQHIQAGKSISSTARYFLRALARQDMICSLTLMRRPLIPSPVWLDQACEMTADRLMGFTVTLMPLLEELCVLASDIQEQGPLGQYFLLDSEPEMSSPMASCMENPFIQRAGDLALRLRMWYPTPDYTMSVSTARKCWVQAYAYRSAALLYLHRLIHPAESSYEADRVALGMACGVLAHLSAPARDLKLCTWPTFIAACELAASEDRTAVMQIFDGIYRLRNTVTTLRAKEFCVQRVWHARDNGLDWNWMNLVQQYPGECIPI